MTVKKLTDADRKEILDLYRHTGETTSTLAERYGVSNSTISRFLKVTLPEDEYETLIAAKRAARTPGGEQKPVMVSEPAPQEPVAAVVEVPPTPVMAETTTPKPIRRQRSSTANPIEQPVSADVQLELLETPTPVAASSTTEFDSNVNTKADTISEILGEELLDESDDLEDDDDLDDEDLDDDDLDDDLDEDEDEDEDEKPILRRRLPVESFVKVMPLSEATLPRTCYLVIDRTAELITRPLREFADLGQIPIQEVQQKTLPVFDNHRVARRFSSKRDRVIKVPDSRILQKARSQLQAKGITRLLFDGRVYSLSPN